MDSDIFENRREKKKEEGKNPPKLGIDTKEGVSIDWVRRRVRERERMEWEKGKDRERGTKILTHPGNF